MSTLQLRHPAWEMLSPLIEPWVQIFRPFIEAVQQALDPPVERPRTPLTPEQKARIKALVDASAFVSLLEAAYTVGMWLWKLYDPASAEVAEAVVLLVRACKILL